MCVFSRQISYKLAENSVKLLPGIVSRVFWTNGAKFGSEFDLVFNSGILKLPGHYYIQFHFVVCTIQIKNPIEFSPIDHVGMKVSKAKLSFYLLPIVSFDSPDQQRSVIFVHGYTRA